MKFLVYMVAVIIGLGVLAMSWYLQKDKMSSLVLPGPLVNAHAKYEKDCSQCHSSFDKTGQSNLCVTCHKEVGEDLQLEQGFHGRFPAVEGKQCKICHTEHIGRAGDIIQLDRETFDHNFTDFTLTGSHIRSNIGCADCHQEAKKFREAPADCYSCHKKDDRHDAQLGTDCTKCHKSTSWMDTFFDHSQTPFPLEGGHKNISCDTCHANNVFKNTPKDCVSCHLINDIHDSPMDAKCGECHTPKKWNQATYDHNRLTKFELKDKHASVTCDVCHSGFLFEIKLGKKCSDCHATHDIHKGRNGNRCDECHSTRGWDRDQVTFDHNKNTKFQLLGLHEQVQCDACHKNTSRDEKLNTACTNCHQADDVHQGQLNDCAVCHNEKGWVTEVRFDHDLTAFPLIGIHAVTSCGECHLASTYKDAQSDCASCHERDDFHKRVLGPNCGSCHNPNGWRLWEFDHDIQTDYVLKGVHRELLCSTCHTDPVEQKIRMGKDCYSCHAKDNIHGGKYSNLSRRCDLCHTLNVFDEIKKEKIREFHDNPLRYDVQLSENCNGCHSNNDIHNGEFGQRCDRCHSVNSFKEITIGR